ncbi:GvpL/GvpF family gas vesicle protein [Rossellomorea aquimaris]|uniref:GvpL/GvpF family gas vesicle protein n=1 Tax=Rossellomorea aquimaris TaxID=189382 RepID=A0A5D4U6A5_9BACI|nr:GvpL/GvpF family gas vesicle protein [Rossellomorea aquimaris]TYS76174.1 GvpL/GvpF family gas vesicle protein [Rossellomorea aquimaris]TYS82609.1 GvpL/GvpF family gas vesicle protein [Rossellomorea aquimaris]
MSDLLYLYGLIPTKEANEKSLPSMKGFDGEGELYTIEIGDVTAIVCDLQPNEYSEETIKDKVDNDMDWLQEKAFHHHETVLMVSKMYTIIPLKFCTLYKNEDSLKSTIEGSRNKLETTFTQLDGNEEWNVKIYCDDKLLKKQVSESNPSIEAKRKEISELPKGRQFFEKKKIDQLIDRELENEKNRLCEEVHEKLKEHSLHGNIKKNWSKDVTGRQEHMAWNSVFLLPVSNVDEFVEEIKQYEEDLGHAGWKIEASGPWPPYHFSSFS